MNWKLASLLALVLLCGCSQNAEPPQPAGERKKVDESQENAGPVQTGPVVALPEGHRAVQLRVSPKQMADGFAAVPHSRIDIASAARSENDNNSETRIILQKVLVLAASYRTVTDKQGAPVITDCDMLTVALTPEDAIKLDAEKQKGELLFFLRPFGNATVPGNSFVERREQAEEATASKTVGSPQQLEEEKAKISKLLPPGHKAVKLRVHVEQIGTGIPAVPNSRIDIALVRDEGTRIILQNVLVLEFGSGTYRDEGKAILSDTVTVALIPEDALKAAVAEQKGVLSFFLRPFSDPGTVKVGLIDVDRAFAPSKDKTDDDDDLKPSTAPPVTIEIAPPQEVAPRKNPEEK